MATPTERFELRELLLATSVVLVAIPFAFLVYEVRRQSALVDADIHVAHWFHVHVRDSRPLTVIMETLSFLGSAGFLVPVVAAVALWIARRRTRKLGIFLAVTCLGGSLLNSLVKILVGRGRPVFDDPIVTALGKSFPSGHAMGSLICYGAMLLALLPLVSTRSRPALIAATSALVIGIGISRLALGVHYLSDVLGGFVLGAAWLIGSVALFGAWRRDELASENGAGD